MDDRRSVVIDDHAHLERLTAPSRADEHRDVGVIGFEASPVVSQCVEHVVIGDTVLAGARLDVDHFRTLVTAHQDVNMC